MNIPFFRASISMVFCGLFLASCGQSYSSRVDDYASLLAEEALCDTDTLYTNGISVLGTATFEKRTIDLTTEVAGTTGNPPVPNIKLRMLSLGDPLPAALPIRHAEVIVYNSLGEKVQCGRTDDQGNIKALDGVSTLKIPNSAGSYKLKVSSRSYVTYNSDSADYAFISVKKDKYRNEPHTLITNFTNNGSSTVSVSLTAHARQTDSLTVEGGAFNILNSLQTAFDYIKNNTGAVDTKCLSQKLNVYWQAGFNPVQYQSPNSDPQTLGNTSYYMATTKELFITGGQLGDISLSNTDHYDDFAIIHEFGHFVEDQCGQWVSPGGNHTLITRIDPRLAWSEGWANFLAAHVIHQNLNTLDSSLTQKLLTLTENNPDNSGWTYFFNSYGFNDSVQNIGNGDGFFIDLKRAGTNPGAYQSAPYTGLEFDRVNPSAYRGEGHTREGAISRGLFKVSNVCGINCTHATTAVSFENIWKSFDQQTGMASEHNPFSASDKFLEKVYSFTSGDWTASVTSNDISKQAVIESEALHLVSSGAFDISNPADTEGTGVFLTWPGYGRSLQSGSCDLKIEARSDGSLNNSSSDPRYSNHFYTIDFALLPVGTSKISVTFDKRTGTSVDHDLLLFKSGYFFNDDYTCLAYTNGFCTSFLPNRNSSNEDVVAMDRTPSPNLVSDYIKSISLSGLDSSQKYLLDIRAWTAGLTIGSNTSYRYVINAIDSGNNTLGVLCP